MSAGGDVEVPAEPSGEPGWGQEAGGEAGLPPPSGLAAGLLPPPSRAGSRRGESPLVVTAAWTAVRRDGFHSPPDIHRARRRPLEPAGTLGVGPTLGGHRRAGHVDGPRLVDPHRRRPPGKAIRRFKPQRPVRTVLVAVLDGEVLGSGSDRKSTRLNSSHVRI